MDLETQTRNAQTFDFTRDDAQTADVFVKDIDATGRAILGGKTYHAREAIKADRPTTQYKFDPATKDWSVDAGDDSLDSLEASLADAGFSFAAQHRDDPIRDFVALLDAVQEGDHVDVVYAKKNGNGSASRSGEVTSRRRVYTDVNDGYTMGTGATWGLVFVTDDDKTYRVKPDNDGVPAVWSSGYYPYMGAVESVTVTPAADADDVAPEVAAD